MNIKRKVLLKEIKSVEVGRKTRGESVDFKEVYKSIKEEKERSELVVVLVKHKLSFFAQKLINLDYEK